MASNPPFPWQGAAWQALLAQWGMLGAGSAERGDGGKNGGERHPEAGSDAGYPPNRAAHALLIHGRAGIGKTAFARHAANALLCEAADARVHPCGACAACNWFSQGNHPDFHLVCPESMAPVLASSADSDASADAAPGGAARGKEAGADKSDGGEGSKTRAPSKEIKVDQIRALLNFCGIGAHRGGQRVVLLYPAEAMNPPAANALLKTLEEPPPGVTFLLVTANLDRLLPTIISRCRQWPLSLPDTDAALTWLKRQPGIDARLAGDALAQSGGAPLTAWEALADPQQAALRPLRELVLEQLQAGAGCDAFACAEALQKVPVPPVLGWVQRWVYDVSSVKLAQRVRYFPSQQAALERCAAQADAAALAQLQRALLGERATEQHPLNARMVFESLFMQYRAVFA